MRCALLPAVSPAKLMPPPLDGSNTGACVSDRSSRPDGCARALDQLRCSASADRLTCSDSRAGMRTADISSRRRHLESSAIRRQRGITIVKIPCEHPPSDMEGGIRVERALLHRLAPRTG